MSVSACRAPARFRQPSRSSSRSSRLIHAPILRHARQPRLVSARRHPSLRASMRRCQRAWKDRSRR
eukprot:2478463-Rhodomonas_salina.1